jgi:hypothetical protein
MAEICLAVEARHVILRLKRTLATPRKRASNKCIHRGGIDVARGLLRWVVSVEVTGTNLRRRPP